MQLYLILIVFRFKIFLSGFSSGKHLSTRERKRLPMLFADNLTKRWVVPQDVALSVLPSFDFGLGVCTPTCACARFLLVLSGTFARLGQKISCRTI